jgi:hypothetical protein
LRLKLARFYAAQVLTAAPGKAQAVRAGVGDLAIDAAGLQPR